MIFQELYCGWVCDDCCRKYGWVEDRVLPSSKKIECENCQKEYIGGSFKQMSLFGVDLIGKSY
ncbi:MAG: hypothetical protein H9W82_12315 [Lactobacillus sp.]|nr:hypothetical protein [Lactobacillus sp.]